MVENDICKRERIIEINEFVNLTENIVKQIQNAHQGIKDI